MDHNPTGLIVAQPGKLVIRVAPRTPGGKESLVRTVASVEDPARAAAPGLPNPFRSVEFDSTLLAAG
jgi:hypothetical protein